MNRKLPHPNARSSVSISAGIEEHNAGSFEGRLECSQCACPRVCHSALDILDRHFGDAGCLREIGLFPADQGTGSTNLGRFDHEISL